MAGPLAIDSRSLARLLGGEASGSSVLAPGPGHSKRDRSLSVLCQGGDFIVHSFAGDDPLDCRDYVRQRAGLPAFSPGERDGRTSRRREPSAERVTASDCHNRDKARWLWSCRRPIEGTPAEGYLRGRGYSGPFPATLGYLPPRGEHLPALIAAFTIPDEPDPEKLAVASERLAGVHLTRLQPDGSGKAGDPTKIMLGRSIGFPIVLAPMNDLLGLVICEGIETGLSLLEATGCSVWAAASATRMPALADAVPPYADCVTIAGEPDPAGRNGAVEIAERLDRRGIHAEVRFLGEAGR